MPISYSRQVNLDTWINNERYVSSVNDDEQKNSTNRSQGLVAGILKRGTIAFATRSARLHQQADAPVNETVLDRFQSDDI